MKTNTETEMLSILDEGAGRGKHHFVSCDLFLIFTDQGDIREVRLVKECAESFCSIKTEILSHQTKIHN